MMKKKIAVLMVLVMVFGVIVVTHATPEETGEITVVSTIAAATTTPPAVTLPPIVGAVPRIATDRGPVVSFPTLNPADPSGQITVTSNGTEVLARVAVDRIVFEIPEHPPTRISMLIRSARGDALNFDITGIPGLRTAILPATAMQRITDAELGMTFTTDDGVTEFSAVRVWQLTQMAGTSNSVSFPLVVDAD